jgi:hypothetical protein
LDSEHQAAAAISSSPPLASHNFAHVRRLCRIRHSLCYAEFLNMPNDRAMAAA